MRRERSHRLRHFLEEIQRQHRFDFAQAILHLLVHVAELVRRPGDAQRGKESVQVLQALYRLAHQRQVVATTCRLGALQIANKRVNQCHCLSMCVIALTGECVVNRRSISRAIRVTWGTNTECNAEDAVELYPPPFNMESGR